MKSELHDLIASAQLAIEDRAEYSSSSQIIHYVLQSLKTGDFYFASTALLVRTAEMLDRVGNVIPAHEKAREMSQRLRELAELPLLGRFSRLGILSGQYVHASIPEWGPLTNVLQSVEVESDPLDIASRLLDVEIMHSELVHWEPEMRTLRFFEEGYGSLRIFANPVVRAFLLYWPYGASSDIHDHGISQGVDMLLSGALRVQAYSRNSIGQSVPSESGKLKPGQITLFYRGDIHQTDNPVDSEQARLPQSAVSLLLYWPPLNLSTVSRFSGLRSARACSSRLVRASGGMSRGRIERLVERNRLVKV